MPKRKLDENDVPTPTDTIHEKPLTFADFDLEPRLLRGIRDQKWSVPTPVQAKAIPLALEGKDILARSGTGTGKTAAYLLPVLNATIRRQQQQQRETTALILVPTKELAGQVTKLAKSLVTHCGDGVKILNIGGKDSEAAQKAKLAELPNIVIATPARANAAVKNGALSTKALAELVVDEGDLVMGYGFKDDLDMLAKALPQVQTFVMSATLNNDLQVLQKLFCRDPVILKLDDEEKVSMVKQYSMRCGEDEKFLITYALYALKLVKGRSIIFVGDIDRSYRLKLFLDQFGINSAVLNAELPLTSRQNVVEQFNKGVYSIMIASDDLETMGAMADDADADEGKPPKKKAKDEDKPQKKKAKTQARKDFGVSRGIDFIGVSCVLNFDFPENWKQYFHRIGRTARAGKTGTAISFIVPRDKFRKHKPTSFASAEHDEEVFKKVEKHQQPGQSMEDFAFDMKKLDSFRYRFNDALKAVTKIAIREARIKELRQELLKSEKLSRYFEENPEALTALRHDTSLNHPMRVQQHLHHIPDYLLPGGSRKAEDIGFVGLENEKGKRDTGRKFTKRKNRPVRGRNGKIDPLKTFNKRGRGKK